MTQKDFTSSQAGPQPVSPEAAGSRKGGTQLALNYLTGGLLYLLGSRKHDPAARFHGYHALFTQLSLLAGHTILGMVGGNFLLLQALADLAAAGFNLFQIYRAYQGDPIEVPLISEIARKQAEPSSSTNQTLQ